MIFENAAEEIKGMDSVQADIKPGVIPSEPNPLLPFVFAQPYISWETNKVRISGTKYSRVDLVKFVEDTL